MRAKCKQVCLQLISRSAIVQNGPLCSVFSHTLVCFLNVWPVCVCVFLYVSVHVVKHSSRAKGFSCPRGYFPVRCMPLVDQGGLFLGSENFGLEEMEERKKIERKRRKRGENHHGLEHFFQESISGKGDCGAELCLSKQTT